MFWKFHEVWTIFLYKKVQIFEFKTLTYSKMYQTLTLLACAFRFAFAFWLWMYCMLPKLNRFRLHHSRKVNRQCVENEFIFIYRGIQHILEPCGFSSPQHKLTFDILTCVFWTFMFRRQKVIHLCHVYEKRLFNT